MTRRAWVLAAGATAIALAAGVIVALLVLPGPRETSVATPTSSVAPSLPSGTPPAETRDATIAPTTAATATATASAPPPAEIELAMGDVVHALVDDLRVRTEPRSDAEASHALSIGEQAVVVGGPEVADGYQWFEVRQGPGGATGWVASGTHAGAWLARVTNGWLAAAVFTDSSEGRLVAVAPDGSEQRVLAEGTAEASFVTAYPVWSPIGTELLAVRAGTAEERATYRIPAEGGDLQRVGTGVEGAWSPDGSLVATGVDGGIEVVDASGESRLIEIRLERPFSIRWSPDGSALAFAASNPDPQIDEPWRLFTIPVEGGQPTAITGHGYFYTAGWSPDGRWIAYIEFTLSAEPGPSLHIVEPDGDNDVSLTEVESAYEAYADSAWSPDGSGVLALVDGEIVIVNAVDGSKRTVAALPEGHRGYLAAWSPDGRAIAVVSFTIPARNAPPEEQLIVVNTDGTGMQAILDGPRALDWQPVLRRGGE